MSTGAILIGIVLIIGTIPFITSPLKKRGIKFLPLSGNEDHQKINQTDPNPILRAISELDFDHQLGKINEEDYKNTRIEYLKQAAEVYINSDTHSDVDIESLIALKKQSLKQGEVCHNCEHGVSAHDSFCKNCGVALQSVCLECNNSIAPNDQFCAYCGAEL